MQLNPLHRGRNFVIMGVGWMCAVVFSAFGEEAGVVDISGIIDVAVLLSYKRCQM